MMWEAYGKNGRAIRIGTTREKVGLLKDVSVIDVDYKEIKLSPELSRVFRDGQIHLGEVFRTKKPIYRHECECRLMSNIDTSWIEKGRLPFSAPPQAIRASIQSLVDQGAMTMAQLEESMAAWFKQACVKPISFAHVPNFIDSVLVGPRATAEFSLEIEQYCRDNGIGFVGKSKMLEFELPAD
ncbi:hypothetical protein [Noviherbaspirillum sp.]|uniref:hypothetical protein n=1 Tax=Noviherbaspirillum sp. TaxID=1926288 RepID=UPI002B4A9DEA|nr:hypothetical protein [Noviherbaspirillum sp.]HJV83668.1 hypothetical protein [Noviherbaspirillum sp.]